MSVDRLKTAKNIVSQSIETFHTKKGRLHSNQLEKHCIVEPSDPWVTMHPSTEKALSSIAEQRLISFGLIKYFLRVRPINILGNSF